MTTSHAGSAEELFHRALECEGPDRRAFLDEACRGASELRDEVEALLASAEHVPDGFLRGYRAMDDYHFPPGAQVGPYEVVAPIGAGGMGIVYEAKQPSMRRRVALKVIRPGRFTKEVTRRFRHEAEILGHLHHPGIAQIYAAGVDELISPIGVAIEVPYLAMELVRGKQLVEHARRQELGAEQKLELLARVCDAIHHAHQRGVIHRDLKPENILVEESDDPIGQPKVLDFGIARVIGDDELQRTLETRTGQIVGTLSAMSPEQVSGDRDNVDVRTDVYALGVQLFQLLTDRPPIDVSSCSVPEAARRICEESPAKLVDLDPALRGDISVIVAKSLEKAPARRYSSVAALASDLRSHIHGQPIAARADSTFYLLSKVLRRHRAFASVLALLGLVVLVFGIVASVQSASNRALSERLREQLSLGNIERGRLFAQNDQLHSAEELLWKEHLAAPSSRITSWALWELYRKNPVLRRVPPVHGDYPTLVAGRDFYATSGSDGTLRLWSAADFSELAVHRVFEPTSKPRMSSSSLALHPSQEILAVRRHDGSEIAFVSTDSGRILERMLSGEDTFGAVLFGHEGNGLYVGRDSGRLERIDWRSGCVLDSWAEHAGPITHLSISHDGAQLASASADGTVRLWSTAQRASEATLQHGDRPHALAYSQDGRWLAVGDLHDRQITVLDRTDLEVVQTLHAPSGGVLKWLHFAGDGTLYSGSSSICSWDWPSGRKLHAYPMVCETAALSERQLVVAAPDGPIAVWDMRRERDAIDLPGHDARTVAAWNVPRNIAITGDARGTLRLWETPSGTLLDEMQFDTAIRDVRVQADGPYAAVGTTPLRPGADGDLTLVDIDRRERLWTLAGANGRGGTLAAFHPSEPWVACAGAHHDAWVAHLADGAELFRIDAGSETISVAFSPHGRSLVTSHRDSTVRVWDMNGVLRELIELPHVVWSFSFSPDGRHLALPAWSHNVYLLDTATLEIERVLEGHERVVWNAVFSPDGRTVATAAGDGTVKLWDAGSGRCLATLDDFAGWSASRVFYGPDDRSLLTTSRHGHARLIDLAQVERCVAGNLEHWLGELGPQLTTSGRPAVRAELRSVLPRPKPLR